MSNYCADGELCAQKATKFVHIILNKREKIGKNMVFHDYVDKNVNMSIIDIWLEY